jgi:hypothetical protein
VVPGASGRHRLILESNHNPICCADRYVFFGERLSAARKLGLGLILRRLSDACRMARRRVERSAQPRRCALSRRLFADRRLYLGPSRSGDHRSHDSSLEGDGFEPPVPGESGFDFAREVRGRLFAGAEWIRTSGSARENGYRSESSGFVYLPETVRVSSKDLPTSGTEVSNPLPLQQRVERTTIA